MDHPDRETARLAALAALRRWATRRDRLPADRARLLAAAWHAGERTIRELARVADVSRDTVYADLKAEGVDPTDRAGPPQRPRYAPLRHAEVSELAEQAAAVLTPAMLTETPDPLASAAWQAHIVLSRIATLLDPQLPAQDRATLIDDLAHRGDAIRRDAHTLLAAEQTPAELAARTEQYLQDVCDVQAVVHSATVRAGLPDTGEVTVEIDTVGHLHPEPGRPPGWTTWRSPSGHQLTPAGPLAHLEVASALAALGEALTAALGDAVFEEA
jgi:hypothetical protein